MVTVNGVDLRVDAFGDAGDPALLLIGGAAGSTDWWDPVFCERLAAGRRFVVRYDHPAGRAPNPMADLAADAVGVLDAIGVRSAHLVGMSLGAVVALRVAVDSPDRVESLALLSASPGGPGRPPMSDDLQAYFEAEPWPTDWSGVDTGEPIRARLGEVRAPALVIHGTPPGVWPTVVAALLKHTSGGWRAQEDRLASRSLAAGDATGWFDQLYAAGAAGELDLGPWERDAPQPLLVEWSRARGLSGHGQRAIVVGCGLGADAEHVAGLGYDTTAFDIADSAVRLARQRHPASRVEYVTADLLDLPTAWVGAFDLVVEVITVQALPEPPRRRAIVNIGRLVAPGGTLVAVASRRDDSRPDRTLPPWPLTRAEVDAFAGDGLRPVSIEEHDQQGGLWWRAEFRRPPVQPR
jgi:pimeloyl-ACP methyl ester carboxylesterase